MSGSGLSQLFAISIQRVDGLPYSQKVRFARPDILFCDEFRIDVYQLDLGSISHGVKTKDEGKSLHLKPGSKGTVLSRTRRKLLDLVPWAPQQG